MSAAARSAGLLLYRWTPAEPGSTPGLEVLIGHMGGPFWARKEAGAWTIPKGEYTEDEDPYAAALREFTEELGVAPPPGPDLALGVVRQRAGKTVTAWAREGDLDPRTAVSNLFEIEWPPRSGRRQSFPELDRVQWVPVARARELLVAGQAELVERLVAALV